MLSTWVELSTLFVLSDGLAVSVGVASSDSVVLSDAVMLSDIVEDLLALGNVRSVLGTGLLSSVDDGVCDDEASGSEASPGQSNVILGLRVSTSKTPQSKPASCEVSRSSSNHQMLCFPNRGQPTSLQYLRMFSIPGSDPPCASPIWGQPVSVIHTGV